MDFPTAPQLLPAFEIRAQVGKPLALGMVPQGQRRIVPILGGTFQGAGQHASFQGHILPGGADWQILRADEVAELDTRYTLETDSGQLVYVQNAGIRTAPPDVFAKMNAGQPVDQAEVYFRTVPKFETSAPELQWLTRSMFMGAGERRPHEVLIRFWRIE